MLRLKNNASSTFLSRDVRSKDGDTRTVRIAMHRIGKPQRLRLRYLRLPELLHRFKVTTSRYDTHHGTLSIAVATVEEAMIAKRLYQDDIATAAPAPKRFICAVRQGPRQGCPDRPLRHRYRTRQPRRQERATTNIQPHKTNKNNEVLPANKQTSKYTRKKNEPTTNHSTNKANKQQNMPKRFRARIQHLVPGCGA